MEFKQFNEKIQIQFALMCETGQLFRADISGDVLWDAYLGSYTEDPIFRDPESTSHNCNNCKNFIRRYGNIVAIASDGTFLTLFGNSSIEEPYLEVAQFLDLLIKSKPIKNVFFETFNELYNLPYESCTKNNTVFKLGVSRDLKRYTREEAEKFGVVEPNEIRTFDHFHIDVPAQFVDKTGKSVEAIMGHYRDKYSVYKRTMEEISLDTYNLVRDLINQGSLLDGTAHLHSINEIISAKILYDNVSFSKDAACWIASYMMEERTAKFRNTLIGQLCVELSEGLELNKACENWNKRVDPVNYHKATAPITKKQIEEAKKFVVDNGYESAFSRRLAVIDDIKASEIKHINSGDGKLKEVSIFDEVKSTSTQHKRSTYDNVEEISIEKFLTDILPSCTSVEALLKNNHEGNLVTLTTSKDESSKPIFKWSNNYSWTFNGNLAGKSQIKDAVKGRGGKVDGILNIRLAFPETTKDYDLHMVEPNGTHISYNNVRQLSPSSGMLDLDAQGIDGHQPPERRVENISYGDLGKMPEGNYKVYINDYSRTSFRTGGFLIEIETPEGIIPLSFKGTNSSNNVNVAIINLKNGVFTVTPDSSMTIGDGVLVNKTYWGLETNTFHKVNLVCLSPNHWGENQVGNKHYMFMLDGCKTDTPVRGFHNENLIPDLLKHKKVMEVLGSTSMIEPTERQLSGIGFNSTVRDELIVKCSGSFKRMLKIKF